MVISQEGLKNVEKLSMQAWKNKVLTYLEKLEILTLFLSLVIALKFVFLHL